MNTAMSDHVEKIAEVDHSQFEYPHSNGLKLHTHITLHFYLSFYFFISDYYHFVVIKYFHFCATL